MSISMSIMDDLIKEGDHVVISGGGTKRIMQVKKGFRVRLGNSGSAEIQSLVGMRFGSVVRLNHKGKTFVATNEYPDLDISAVGEEADTTKDNRDLIDNNQSQQLSSSEVAAIREEGGVDALLDQLVENSATFQNKTQYAQEKYLRRKKKKYGTLFKLERVTVEQMAEVHIPTINPSDQDPEESKALRLRADTVALMLHLSEVHASSRVLMFERTNGVLPTYFLTRLGPDGRIFQVLEKNGQPNTFHTKMFQMRDVKSRWKAVPNNEGFLLGVETKKEEVPTGEGDAIKGEETPLDEEGNDNNNNNNTRRNSSRLRNNNHNNSNNNNNSELKEDEQNESPSSNREGGQTQWLKGLEAHHQLKEQPADSLVIADDVTAASTLADLFPFLAYGGHLVIYTPFLEDLSPIFSWLRRDCVNIRVSETWYRHHQVLPQRTHPTVNMSTAAGYLLTAIKINPANRPGFSGSHIGEKRPRE